MVMMKAGENSPLNKALKLVICEIRQEEVEWLISSLRNQGVASRPFQCVDENALISCVKSQEPDVVVVGESFKAIGLSRIKEILSSLPIPIPLVMSSSSLQESEYVQWRLAGIDDVLVRSNSQLAVKVILDKAELYQLRKEAQIARVAMEDTDRRCDALINAVAEPIAYLNEGLHVKANTAYMELFEISNFEDDLEGVSLLDFTTSDSSAIIKEKIKRIGRGQQDSEEVEIQLNSGKTFAMNFSSAMYEGEACLQVSVKRSVIEITTIDGIGVVGPGAPPPGYEDWLVKDIPTGLFNRSHFMEQVHHSKLYESAWLVQLDQHDKTLGVVGVSQLDPLISEFGQKLQTLFGPEVKIARWTTDTLGVWGQFGSIPSEDKMIQFQKELALMMLDVNGRSLHVTMSAGGVVLNEALSADAVANHLEKSLRVALASKTSGVSLLDPFAEKKALLEKNSAKMEDVATAIAENRVVIKYQPIAGISEGGFSAYEVRTKIRLRSGELISESEYGVLAKELNIQNQIDWHMVKSVVRAAKSSAKKEKFSIPLTEALLKTPDASQAIAKVLIEDGVAPEQIILDCSSSVTEKLAREVKSIASDFQMMGGLLILSEFNEEDVFKNKIEQFRPDWIRISNETSAEMDTKKEIQEVIKGLVSKAHSQNVKVIVSGVSSSTMLSSLFVCQVDAAQGGFLSNPSEIPNYDFSLFM